MPDAAGTPTPAGREVRGTSGLVELEEIRRAAERIRPAARRTPLLAAAPGTDAPPPRPGVPGSAGPGRIWLKCESLQHAGAFKLRGAWNFIISLPEAERAAGVVTYSSGNHGQAVAWCARELGIPATIVMPVDAPRVKRDGALALGARVEQEGRTTLERRARAEEILAASGGVMVPPFDDARIIAGQGTAGLELHEQLAGERQRAAGPPVGRLARVLVPIGGGGLISGVAAAVRALEPGAEVFGVEPEGAAKMRRSLDAGRPVTLARTETVADGLRPVRPGDLTFAHVAALVRDVVLVSDDEIRAAVAWCFARGLVVEPSGAAALAALLVGRVPPAADGETGVLLSGGNLDPRVLATCLEMGA
ncbi:MAG: threonine/serine dehydratase [Gemmatimonadota bacterium]|nr:threonine/serine dehydratase [Gemmatimonadota bacterium]